MDENGTMNLDFLFSIVLSLTVDSLDQAWIVDKPFGPCKHGFGCQWTWDSMNDLSNLA